MKIQLFCLIGYPLEHSFSGSYFSEKFRALGLSDYAYKNFPLASISELPDFLSKHPELRGFNVTIPYKQSILPFLDEVDPEALAVGAVNCVRIDQGKLTGFNTDIYGFKQSIKPFLENHYERALVLGAGGASKAVAYVLREWGIPFFFVSRSAGDRTIGYTDLSSDALKHYKLIINTTPLGMSPDIGSAPPIPYESLGPGHFLYDLVYNPEETLFLKRGREAGAKTMNGLSMLHLQAEKSWQIWESEAL